MKKEYDLRNMKSRKNPYAAKLKRQVTIRMGDDVIDYFKQLVCQVSTTVECVNFGRRPAILQFYCVGPDEA